MKVTEKQLKNFIYNIFLSAGLKNGEAEIAADNLVFANLTGHDSHGVLRTKIYIDRIKNGGVNLNPNIRTITETETTALIDADDALGATASYKAAQLAREKANKMGMSFISVKNSNHFGATAFWTSLIAQEDMISFACTNTEALMAPPGGKEVLLGTNPLSVCVPTGNHGALNYDIATSAVAQGKIFDARIKGITIPEGWGVDAEGQSTTDPNKAIYLVPFGGHKGFGLAVLVEILSSVLSGSVFGRQVNGMYEDTSKPNSVSHSFMSIKIDSFRNVVEFKNDMDRFIEHIHETNMGEGQSVYYPGEIENINRKRREKEGIVLPESLVLELKEIAKTVGSAITSL